MATVDLVPVLMGHVTLPGRVEARFRTYANDKAVEEFSRFFSEDELTAIAQKAGRSIWTEEDILVASRLPDATWGGSTTGAELRQDLHDDAEHLTFLEQHLADLQARVDAMRAALAPPVPEG